MLEDGNDYAMIQCGFQNVGFAKMNPPPALCEVVSPEDFLKGILLTNRYLLSMCGAFYSLADLKRYDIPFDHPIHAGEDYLRLTIFLTQVQKNVKVCSSKKLYYYRLGAGTNGVKMYTTRSFYQFTTRHFAYKQLFFYLSEDMKQQLIKVSGPPEDNAYLLEAFGILMTKVQKQSFDDCVDIFCKCCSEKQFIEYTKKYLKECRVTYLRCSLQQYIREIFFFSSLLLKHIIKTIFFIKRS